MLSAWVRDGLVPVAEARVSIYDRGFRSGEGVFETVRSYGPHLFRLEPHLARAESGATALGFDFPTAQVRVAAKAVSAANAPHLNGADSASTIFCATMPASSTLARFDSMTANSSPLSRPTVSLLRTHASMRAATWRNSSSPAAWP